MALTPGSRLGSYEIIAAIGAGGMGEVYQARDTRLKRDVAIKVLLDAFTQDADRLARFQREAELLATLNHPNIAGIYGLEDSPSTSSGQAAVRALVLEFVEGPTLADRIAQGPIPLDEALAIARQIADALETAHEKGVIHRDLKPANIKVTPDGTVKVLDFGLAKMLEREAAASSLTMSPTLSVHATYAGVILGTAAYMSPEQARARPLDKRTDVWAFGCVLFEMLTGTVAFKGEDLTDTIATVVKNDPDWNALQQDLPDQIRLLVKKCLVKDPRARISDVGVAKFLMTETLAPASAPVATAVQPPARYRALALTGVGLLAGAVVTAAAAWVVIKRNERPPQIAQFTIVPPAAQRLQISTFDRDFAISPDGNHIVYVAVSETGQRQLMARAIDRLDAVPLHAITGATIAVSPFISPDGRWVGFFEAGDLKKVSITGGPPITLCRPNGPPRGASWGPDDTIVLATGDGSTGLLSVPARGGDIKLLTKPDAAHGEADHLFPSVLPGGQAALFTITAPGGEPENYQVAVLDLKSGQRKTLVRGGSYAEYVGPSAGSGQGYLVYAAAGTLRAVRFDPARLEVLSDPVPVVEQVTTTRTGGANFGVSRQGMLVYVPGSAVGLVTGLASRSLVWVTRQGREEPIKAPARSYTNPRVSPDGTRVAVEIRDQNNDIWIWDLARLTLTPLTFDPAPDRNPTWTPDGRRIVFSSARAISSGGLMNLFWQAADGTGNIERLTTSPNAQNVTAISHDGTRVIMDEASLKNGNDIILVELAGQRRVEPLIHTPYNEGNSQISPDDRWIAYQSNESGQFQIYVRPFPKVDSGRWQVSTDGGTRPVWARTGKELFYLDGRNRLTAVPVQATGATFSAGNPSKLLETAYFAGVNPRTYDVAPDGQRFLMIKDNATTDQTTNAPLPSMVVVLNWVEELKRLVPAK